MIIVQYFPEDPNMCVIPNSPQKRESQFEAFQSIIAYILNADHNSPYTLLCRNFGIDLYEKSERKKLKDSSIIKPFIVFKQSTKSTHYIGHKIEITDKKKIISLDPYKFFQSPGTQGFCQLFAFFLSLNDLDDFIKIDDPKIKDFVKFETYVLNTQNCLKKLLNLFNTYNAFKLEFKDKFDQIVLNDTLRTHYGIKKHTTFNQFLSDLEFFCHNLQPIRYYIYDLPINISKSFKQTLWFDHVIEQAKGKEKKLLYDRYNIQSP
jgi:hypothetical protein